MYHLDEVKGLTDKKPPISYANASKNLNKKANFVNNVRHYKKPIGYGSREEYTQRVRATYPIINSTVDSIASQYNINPGIIHNRLDYEGFIDQVARQHDETIKTIKEHKNQLKYLYEDDYRMSPITSRTSGFNTYGLDDGATYINSGKVKPINEQWQDVTNVNENGRIINSSYGLTWVDNVGLLAAHLKYFRDEAIKDRPGLTDKEYDELALAYFNRGIGNGRKYKLGTDKRYSIRNYTSNN